jgi:SNF2 family DNA or RNA helicase
MEDRIHRDGQESDHVVYRDIIAKGTVDERIYTVLKDKKDLLSYMREPSISEFLGGNYAI